MTEEFIPILFVLAVQLTKCKILQCSEMSNDLVIVFIFLKVNNTNYAY